MRDFDYLQRWGIGGGFGEISEKEINGKEGMWLVQPPGLVARLRLWRADGGEKGWGRSRFVGSAVSGQVQASVSDCTLSFTILS